MPQIVAIASQNSPLITNTGVPLSLIPVTGSGVPTVTAAPDNEGVTFQFVAGWILLITILVFANKSRLGHVIIYYSLLLIILLILVSEYQQIVPLLNAIQTVGEFNTANPGNFTQSAPPSFTQSK
jgi:hypothetical protein